MQISIHVNLSLWWILDLEQVWQSPPYGCHSLDSYNICLCRTTEFIQCINNNTMGTFHSATRLSAQWNAVLGLSKHSSLSEWARYFKPTAELHAVLTCGLKPNCALVSQRSQRSVLSHVVKSLTLLWKRPFSLWDLDWVDEYYPIWETREITKNMNFFSLLLPVSLNSGSKWLFPNVVPVEGNVQCKNALEIMMWWVYSDGGWKFSGSSE